MRHPRVRHAVLWGLAVLACGVLACDPGKDKGGTNKTAASRDQMEPSTPKPEYTFAAGLEEKYPDAVSFLRRFLETCLAGDYAGYRRLVARTGDPESRGRFEKILNSLKSLAVQSIEEVQIPQVPPPSYVVTSQVEFLPDRKVALRHRGNNRIAILIVQEEGEFRMALAPPAWQPELDEESATTTSPATAPSYPWQQGGDY